MPGSEAVMALLDPEVRPRIIELLDLAFLDLQSGVVDGSAIDAWRCPRLKARHRKTSLLELLRKVRGGRLTSSSPGNTRLGADMNPAVKESARSDYNAFCSKAPPLEGLNAEYAPFVRREKEPGDSSLHGLESCLLLEERSDCAAV